MGTSFCLIACALATAQPVPTDHSEWLLVPQLTRGQELVYRGSFTEDALGAGVQFNRAYRLETRVFVLDLIANGSEVAFFTTWKQKPLRPERGPEAEPSSVRLERAHMDLRGRVEPAGKAPLLASLEGPPTIECGAFVEVPNTRVRVGRTWETAEAGREPRTWRVAGTETINGTSCVKLVGLQQSADWDKPRADSIAWRRQDTVWMTPRFGYATRVERIIERREPARREPNQRSVLRYELESSLQYPGQLFEDRQREILLAHSLAESLAQLLPKSGPVGPRPFEAILARLTYHFERQPPTPYREVLKRIQLRAEAGKRGETPPTAFPSDTGPVVPVIGVGRPAPDFVVPDLTTHETARLGRLLGRPILMLFYSPTSATADDVLHFAQSMNNTYGQQVTVLGLAVAEDTARILKQHDEMHLKFPVLSGTGLRLSYAVESTPKWVVLDPKGVVRSSLDGWGPEIPRVIEEELKKWVSAPR